MAKKFEEVGVRIAPDFIMRIGNNYEISGGLKEELDCWNYHFSFYV